MAQEHAPTPWRLYKRSIKNGEGEELSVHRQIRDDNNEVVFDGVDEDCGVKIVTAINAHEPLLEAPREALNNYHSEKLDCKCDPGLVGPMHSQTCYVQLMKNAVTLAEQE